MRYINFISRYFFMAFLSVFLIQIPAEAQVGFSFGQNKVQYKDFDWAVFRTKHFDVHYYSEKEKAAKDAARMAERSYAYLSDVLNHQIKERVPLFLYASMNDFQQTNIIQGMIGDGTRGVAESIKRRVILPLTGSYREFNHVLVHELVHAFQFDMMKTYKGDSRFNPPLWFVEGMAEYLSNSLDNTTRMWVRDGLENDNLLTIDQLNSVFDIRVYRLGQSAWYHIGETYGKEKVGEIFKTAVTKGDINEAFRSVIGVEDTSLTKAWHGSMKDLVKNENVELMHPDSLAENLIARKNFFHRVNIVPTISPDGKRIAYIANKNLNDDIYVLKQNDDGTWEDRLLINGGQSNQYESIRFFASTMDWSSDSKLLTFVTKSGANDVLYVADVDADKIIHEYKFEELSQIQSPSFFPENDKIAFSGQAGAWSNLYIVNLNTGELDQITNDRYSVLHPQLSPDGKFISYATDRGEGTNKDDLLFGDYDLALYDLDNGTIKMLTELDGNIINPQWSSDGKTLAFISDHQGIPNIYSLEISSGKIDPITKLKNGISGITETTPAFSWSSEINKFVFSTFVNEGWQIYKMEFVPISEVQATMNETIAGSDAIEINNNDIEKSGEDEVWLPTSQEPNTIFSKYALAEQDSIESREFSNRLRLDGILLGGGLGGFFGSYGGGQLYFSDMLGNHNLFVSSSIQFNDFKRANLGVSYFNQGGRINYGLQVYQTSNAYAAFSSFNSLGFLRQTYRGVNGIAAYPFNRFSRIEVGAGWTAVDQDVFVDSYNGRRIERDSQDLNTLHFAQFGVAYVFDNTMYGPIGPLSGSRYRFSIQQTVKDLAFRTYLADYRKYYNIKFRSVLAWRILGGVSTGIDEQVFRLGGPYTYRGTDYDGLFGSRILMQNLEYRFPLLPFLPPKLDFLSGFTFLDAAAAWGVEAPGFSKETFQPFATNGGFRLNDLNTAVGLGARFSLGFFTLEYYQAWPTDLQGFDKSIGKFSIGTFF